MPVTLRAALALAACLRAAPATARLPPPSDAAKAAAAEKAAKTAWENKMAAFQLCEAQNDAVDNYQATLRQRGETPPAGERMAACANPGEYTPTLPLEQSEAHSPAETATAPPSTNNTEAELKGGVKK